jgi:hypothetical protein
MTFRTVSLISKALTSSRSPTDAERDDALKAFNAWKADSKLAWHRWGKVKPPAALEYPPSAATRIGGSNHPKRRRYVASVLANLPQPLPPTRR